MTTLSPLVRLPFRPALIAAGCLTLAACSGGSGGTGGSASTTGTGTGGHGTTTSGSTSSTASGTTSSQTACPAGMTYGGGETTMTGTISVTAKIVDETGAPIAAGQPIYVCGINQCSPAGTTGANGAATLSTNLPLKKPAFKVGDTVTYAEIAIPVPEGTTDLTAGGTKVINTAKLADSPAGSLVAGTTTTSGDVTITIPAGALVGIDQLIYGSSTDFHAVSIPVANDGPWLAASGKTDFALLYGVSPAETPICPAAQITVALPHATMSPNDLGWAAGTAVEFWIMTTDTGQTYAPYAGWAKASGGTVSADGKSVTTTDGLIYLENFAIRKAQ